jgi:hypothetical protein
MLIEWMMDAGVFLFDAIFALLGILPDFSPEIITAVDRVFEFMFSGVSLVAIFVDFAMVKTLIPFVIAILNFDRIIKVVMFVLKKVPLLNIK